MQTSQSPMGSELEWDMLFMAEAFLAAMKSKDPKTKFGAVLITPDQIQHMRGYNGLPRGVNDDVPERHVAPAKWQWYEHAERNALYNAARQGMSTDKSTMFTLCTPCVDCARGIIQCGIVELVTCAGWERLAAERMKQPGQSNWIQWLGISNTMLEEAGVRRRIYDGPLLTVIEGRFNGETIDLAQLHPSE